MVSRPQLSSTEKSALAKVAMEPQTIGTLPPTEAAHLIDRNMIDEVMGHYVITPKDQLELRRHVYRRTAFRSNNSDAPSRQYEGSARNFESAPLSRSQTSALRSFWTWLQGSNGGKPPTQTG